MLRNEWIKHRRAGEPWRIPAWARNEVVGGPFNSFKHPLTGWQALTPYHQATPPKKCPSYRARWLLDFQLPSYAAAALCCRTGKCDAQSAAAAAAAAALPLTPPSVFHLLLLPAAEVSSPGTCSACCRRPRAACQQAALLLQGHLVHRAAGGAQVFLCHDWPRSMHCPHWGCS